MSKPCTRSTVALVQQLAKALAEYLDAEEIDDPRIRLEELAACRAQARDLIAAAALRAQVQP